MFHLGLQGILIALRTGIIVLKHGTRTKYTVHSTVVAFLVPNFVLSTKSISVRGTYPQLKANHSIWKFYNKEFAPHSKSAIEFSYYNFYNFKISEKHNYNYWFYSCRQCIHTRVNKGQNW